MKDFTMITGKHPNFQAIRYIREISELGKGNLICDNPAHLITLIQNDFRYVDPHLSKEYIDNMINAIPSANLPIILDILLDNPQNPSFTDALTAFLIRSDRPIFQLKALEYMQKLHDSRYLPFVIPLIYSNNAVLQQKAAEFLVQNPDSVESILEQHILDRSENKREIAYKLLFKINPKNLKLVSFLLESNDFLKRIEGIQIMASTGDRKWIEKIQIALTDEDLAVRKSAIEAILNLGGRKAKQIIMKYIGDEMHVPLKEFAARLLNE